MDPSSEARAFEELIAVCRTLRGPEGCPWDREQTLSSMTPYLLEEAAETGDAVARNDATKIAEELGDVVFLGIFCLELLRDQAGIGIDQALRGAADKLIRRHPHVYGNTKVEDTDAAYHQWQHIKQREQGTRSLLGDQPPGLAALVAAYRTQEKAGAVGFDWPDVTGPLAKVREEIRELEGELQAPDPSPATAREVGDLLFAVVNVSRHLGIDPERELRASTGRFRDRFAHIERRLAEEGRTFREATLEEMDGYWNEAKAAEAAGGGT
jgi:tetrapyrrole methylase family protein / MazG family protein